MNGIRAWMGFIWFRIWAVAGVAKPATNLRIHHKPQNKLQDVWCISRDSNQATLEVQVIKRKHCW